MNKNSKALGEENIGKLLKRLSIPAMMGMMVNALYNLVDAIFLGRFVGVDAMGALAIALPIQMIILAFGIMVGIGAASGASRALGAKENEKADNIVGNAFLSTIIIGIMLITVGRTFLTPILILFGATENLLPLAYDYMNTILLGSVFLTIQVVSNNIIRSEGNAKIAMISMMIGTGFNIIMDPIFIEVLNFDIMGAALATIIGQTLGFIYVMSYFLRGKSSYNIGIKYMKPNFEYLKEIFSVGLPTFMRNIAGSVLAIVANNSLGYYGGDIAISVYGVIQRVLRFSIMPMFGIVQGFQPIASYNYGAHNYKRVIEVIKTSLKALIIYATAVIILVQLFPGPIIRLFNSDPELLSLGKKALRIVMIMMPLIGIQVISGSMYQALGKPKPALIVSMSRQTLFLIPLILILPGMFNLGLMGVYLAFPIADALAIILSGYMLKRQLNILRDKSGMQEESLSK